jgi:hypothetical protein
MWFIRKSNNVFSIFDCCNWVLVDYPIAIGLSENLVHCKIWETVIWLPEWNMFLW